MKIIRRILALPLVAVLAVAWVIVKALVGAYSIFQGFICMLFGILIVATILVYHDWVQATFVAVLSGGLIGIIFVGCFVEVMLEEAMRKLLF